MSINLDTGDVEAFAAVASLLSFKAAAARLNISPSALSRRVQKLEEQLDLRLLDRTTRNVRLTLAGKQMLARATEILAHVDELLISLKGQSAPRASLVTIGSIPSIACRLLPDALRRFGRQRPTTRFVIRDMTTNEAVDAVRRGDVDFGITSFVQPDNGLEFRALLRGAVMAVVPKRHPLARQREATWEDLSRHALISTWKGAGIRMVMDVDLAKVRERLAPFYEVQQMYTALKFVEEGLGVAPIPSFFIDARQRRKICVLPLTNPTISVDLGVVTSQEHPLRPSARDFLATLAQSWKPNARERSRSTQLPPALPQSSESGRKRIDRALTA